MRAGLPIAAVVALMALGSLALWIAVPVAWLWSTRELEPSGTRFVLTVPGCALTMLGVAWLLYRLEAVYTRMAGKTDRQPAPSSWMRSSSEGRGRQTGLSLLDVMLVGSALTALIALVVWWAFLADSPNPSGPLQPL